MKWKREDIEKNIIVVVAFNVIISAIIFFMLIISSNYTYSDVNKNKTTTNTSKASQVKDEKVDIKNIISDIKKNNSHLEYENKNEKFTSLVFIDNNRYKSIIIDTNTGKEITFHSLIKEDKINNFLAREQELLNLKYPEFIVSGINNSEGYKIYYVKDNEVIVFYYDYTYLYDYNKEVSLIINYNEIKDYLNFEPILDETYEVENGFNYSSDKKSIAISFDDGPSKKYNPMILEELSKNKAHATFFMVGNMMQSCQLCVLNTYKSGNEIGSHTYEHMNIKKKSIKQVETSLAKTNKIYNEITGDNIKMLRPPYGSYNKKNLENINLPLVLWDLDTEDWRYRDVDYIVNFIKENVSDGSIILMHELYETSFEALKIILPWLYANNYQVVSVSELANLKNKTIEVGHAYRSFK